MDLVMANSNDIKLTKKTTPKFDNLEMKLICLLSFDLFR